MIYHGRRPSGQSVSRKTSSRRFTVPWRRLAGSGTIRVWRCKVIAYVLIGGPSPVKALRRPETGRSRPNAASSRKSAGRDQKRVERGGLEPLGRRASGKGRPGRGSRPTSAPTAQATIPGGFQPARIPGQLTLLSQGIGHEGSGRGCEDRPDEPEELLDLAGPGDVATRRNAPRPASQIHDERRESRPARREPLRGHAHRVAAGRQGRQPEEQENHAPGDAADPMENGPVEREGHGQAVGPVTTAGEPSLPTAPATVSSESTVQYEPGQDDRDPAADPDVARVADGHAPVHAQQARQCEITEDELKDLGLPRSEPARPQSGGLATVRSATAFTASKVSRPEPVSTAVPTRSSRATGA